ncbi:MAG TPA: AarF/UbiB family protein, partial [Burkholderiales bacterium]|nr:AarF/UbiB family protein [Burkholderiales bacterium]
LHWQEKAEVRALDPAVRARRALEDLGPTFVKLGQVLATRVDVFPPNWIAEFEKLQSAVPAVPFDELRAGVEQALGWPLQEVFREVETVAFAAASIAQVHRARLPDGTPVVLKIRRPGIGPRIEADLRIVGHIARLMESEMPELRRYQPVQIVEEFARSLRREMDLAFEARNMDMFRENFAGIEYVVIPRVHWQWTSEVMNVQELIEGVPGTDLAAVDAAGFDRRVLAARAADSVLKMILVDGFFHADPHPGNVFYLPGNRIAMLDFGMVGRLSEVRRDQIVDMLAALSRGDERSLTDVVIEWTGDAEVNEQRLVSDIGGLMFNYGKIAIKDINVGQLLSELTAVMREHSVVVPSDLTLLFKALITLEGYGRQMDPEFRMVAHLTPFVRRLILDRYKPRALARRAERGLGDALDLLSDLPRDVVRLVKEVRRGKFRIELDLKRLDHFGNQLDRSSNRLTLGVLIASLIVGSSIVMTVEGGPTLFGLPLFGLLGFLGACFLSLFLFFSIWRSGRD